jgi:hypothetical protein
MTDGRQSLDQGAPSTLGAAKRRLGLGAAFEGDWMTWFRRAAYAIVGILFVLGAAAGLSWAFRSPELQKSVAEQWIDAISQLGIEPVYPLQEDIVVGDVFAIITKDLTGGDVTHTPLAGRSIKLTHLDLTADIEESYRNVYTFPDTAPRTTNEQSSIQTPSKGSIFKAGGVRSQLPLVVFPGFTIARVKNANATGSSGLGAFFGGSASSDETIEMRISEAETYGVSALVAEDRLIAFCKGSNHPEVCTEDGARQQLSIIVGSAIYETVPVENRKPQMRLAVEIALVSRVFMTRSIESRISRNRAIAGGGHVGQAADEATTSSAERPSSGAQAHKDADEIAKLRAELDSMKKELAAQRSNAPGAELSVQEGDAVTLRLVEKLQRPVVFGFKSVRWTP